MRYPTWMNMLPQTTDPAGGGTGDPSKTTAAATTITATATTTTKTPEEEWEAFLAGVPADVRAKFDTHTTGLKLALTSERKTNKDNADKLKKLTDLEAAEQKRKDADLTEAQKQTAKVAQLEKELADRDEKLATTTIRHAVELEAAKQNFQSPEDAYLMADLSDVKIDADGKVTGVEEALKAVAKAKPYLLKAAGTGTGLGTPRREPQAGKDKQPPETNRRPTIKF